jgi:hypothetical protein
MSFFISCLRSNEPYAVIAGPLPPNVSTAQNAAMTEMDKIEGEQPNCPFTINERWWGRCAFTLIFRTPGYKNKKEHDHKHIMKTLK